MGARVIGVWVQIIQGLAMGGDRMVQFYPLLFIGVFLAVVALVWLGYRFRKGRMSPQTRCPLRLDVPSD